MRTLIIQSFRTHDIPAWIARCLASVRAWAAAAGHDYRLTDDGVFSLCGDDYLAAVGDNMRSITNLCRLELIRLALAEGYELAVWMDADILVFDPEALAIGPRGRITFARETWISPTEGGGWTVNQTLNNCVVACPAGDPDLDLIIETTRHRARHHVVQHNHQVGVELIRGLNRFLAFPLLTNVGMFSNHMVMAVAQGSEGLLRLQAVQHQHPIHAANLCAGEHMFPVVPDAMTHAAIDLLLATRGGIVNAHLGAAAAGA